MLLIKRSVFPFSLHTPLPYGHRIYLVLPQRISSFSHRQNAATGTFGSQALLQLGWRHQRRFGRRWRAVAIGRGRGWRRRQQEEDERLDVRRDFPAFGGVDESMYSGCQSSDCESRRRLERRKGTHRMIELMRFCLIIVRLHENTTRAVARSYPNL